MLIDGHSSRLDPKLLTYINNCNHQWKVCLSVPYATYLWYVGNIKEQNGTFKGEWYRAKTSLYKYKGDFNLELKTSQEDMMPILNRIFEKSYGRVESNLRALSDRGWNPPNRNILDHPDLVGQEQYNGEEQESVEQVDYRSINMETGLSGTCIDKIIIH